LHLSQKWQIQQAYWLDVPFLQVKTDSMIQILNHFIQLINRVKRKLTNYPIHVEKVASALLDHVHMFKSRMPLLNKLRHSGVKAFHWEKISQLIGFIFIPTILAHSFSIFCIEFRFDVGFN
jgi:hypothetical protein